MPHQHYAAGEQLLAQAAATPTDSSERFGLCAMAQAHFTAAAVDASVAVAAHQRRDAHLMPTPPQLQWDSVS